MAYYNPFQGKDLKFPESVKDKVESYCQTRPGGGPKPSPLDSPFRRQVDLWFLSICAGVSKNKRVKDPSGYRFITGEVLANNPEIIELLELLAISETNDPYVINNPQVLVEIANEYAAGGINIVIDSMTKGQSQPLWNMSEYFHDSFTKS